MSAVRADALTVAVIAKECLPGRVKTRLTPPLTPEDAARLAQASLDDTLELAAALSVRRRILFFDGTPPSSAIDAGFESMPQPSGGLDERLGALFDAVDGPLLLIGMDTPQLTATDLAGPLAAWDDAIDAWVGPAADGGFWALALRGTTGDRPRGDLLRGVPMSRDDTGAVLEGRLHDAGLTVRRMPELRDVDLASDAETVAALAPATRFARTWTALPAAVGTGSR